MSLIKNCAKHGGVAGLLGACALMNAEFHGNRKEALLVALIATACGAGIGVIGGGLYNVTSGLFQNCRLAKQALETYVRVNAQKTETSISSDRSASASAHTTLIK